MNPVIGTETLILRLVSLFRETLSTMNPVIGTETKITKLPSNLLISSQYYESRHRD